MLYRALLRLMGRENKRRVVLLQFLFLVTALFQVAGIALIAPFITMISNPALIEINPILLFLYSVYDFKTYTNFMICYAAGVVIVLLLGNLISSYSLWKLFLVSMSLGAHVQRTIYGCYLENDYTFFAMKNSSKLISQITQEVPRMVYMVVQPMLNLVSQMFIAVLIIGGLLIVDIKIAFIATSIVVIVYFFIFKIIRVKVIENGRLITLLNRKKLKLLDESIGGIKEVKLKGNEDYYRERLNDVTVRGLSASAYIALAGDLPKFVVETVVFSSILGLSIYILLTTGTASEAVSIISLYAMAGYKLLPAAQLIYKAYSQIRANESVVFSIDREIGNSQDYNSALKSLGSEPSPEGKVIFDNVGFRYPSANKFALKDCNLSIENCQVTAFVGSSGAGKSTAVDLLLGLMLPTEGCISIGGVLLDRSNIQAWRNRIGYVAQDVFILDASFQENIAFGVPESMIDRAKLEKAAKMANILDFILQCEDGFNFTLGERGAKLSGGQKQRIGIARALYDDPAILIFDEATSALDNVTEQLIMADIKGLAQTRTVVMIAHRLSTVEKANNIFVFKAGKTESQGTFNELARDSAEFKLLLSAGKNQEVSQE